MVVRFVFEKKKIPPPPNLNVPENKNGSAFILFHYLVKALENTKQKISELKV